jgi:multiple sugar transport system permease protein
VTAVGERAGTPARPPARDVAPPRAPWTRDRVERRVFGVLRWVVIAGFLVATLVPFYYMLLLSVRPIESLLLDPGRLLPDLDELTFSTYREVLTPVADGGQGFVRFLLNSAVVAVVSMLLAIAVAIPGAYAVSRLPFAGRRQVSALFLAAYLFPAIVTAIPLFVLFTKLGLRGSLAGLVLVYVSQTVPVAIYMMRNYFETLPEGVEEAAMIDGLGRIGVVRRITLPLALPSIMATGLFVFMIAWNEFLFALLFLLENRDRWTVSLALSELSGTVEVPKTVLMAGSVIITLPVVVLFFLTERLLTEGLTSGAEKG